LLAVALPVGLFLAFWALCYWPLSGLARAIETTVKNGPRWIERSRLLTWAIRRASPIAPYASILIVLILGGIASVGAGYLFGELAEQVGPATTVVNRVDQAINTWFGHERQPAMSVLLRAATTIGGTGGLALIVAVVAGALLVGKQRACAIFLVVTAVAGALLNLGLKMIFARSRPDLASALAAARGYSFPSGHAMGSFITFGALASVALRQRWPWKAKSAVLAIALTMTILVGLSRVYLGVHWASDIIGGWTAGAVWLTSAATAFEILLRLRRRRRGSPP
jgi:undecaprenyl-diphosphatase